MTGHADLGGTAGGLLPPTANGRDVYARACRARAVRSRFDLGGRLLAYSPTRRRLRYIYDIGKKTNTNCTKRRSNTVDARSGWRWDAPSMHVYRPGTEYGQMTGGFMMMMDFSDLFVSLSLCLSLCLSLSLSLYLSLCLSLPDLSVALCLVRCTPRVGVHVHRREDGGIGQETNDRQPVSRRYPGGIQAVSRRYPGASRGRGRGRGRGTLWPSKGRLPPACSRADRHTNRKEGFSAPAGDRSISEGVGVASTRKVWGTCARRGRRPRIIRLIRLNTRTLRTGSLGIRRSGNSCSAYRHSPRCTRGCGRTVKSGMRTGLAKRA